MLFRSPALAIGLPLEPVYCVHTSANKIKQPALVTLLLSCITIALVFIGVNLFTNENIKIIIISGTSSILSLLRLCFYIPVYTAKILNEKKTYLYPIMFRNLFSLIICIIIGFLIKPLLFYNNWIMFFISCAILSIIYLSFNLNRIIWWMLMFNAILYHAEHGIKLTQIQRIEDFFKIYPRKIQKQMFLGLQDLLELKRLQLKNGDQFDMDNLHEYQVFSNLNFDF